MLLVWKSLPRNILLSPSPNSTWRVLNHPAPSHGPVIYLFILESLHSQVLQGVILLSLLAVLEGDAA